MEYLLSYMPSFTKENLENALRRRKIIAYITGCREIANREIHRTNYNFITAVNSNNGLSSLEVLTDLDNVTSILQYLTRTDSMFCGNRFFYRVNNSKTLRSPMGSIITGILKLVVHHRINSPDYKTFVDDIIRLCFTHTNTLGSVEVSASVGVAIRLFLDINNLPDDPRGPYTYGTYDYLTSTSRNIRTLLGEDKVKEYRDYFFKLGAKPETLVNIL